MTANRKVTLIYIIIITLRSGMANTPKIQNMLVWFLGFTEVFVVFGVFHKQFKGIKLFYPFNFKND